MAPARSEHPELGLPAAAPAPPAQPARSAPAGGGAAGAGEQETDVWWGSYSARTMVPTFVVCVVISAGVGLLAGRLWDEQKANAQLVWHLAVLLIAAVWLVPLLLCAYRTTAITYRLTTRRLVRDRGFRHPPSDGEVDLARVTAVRVQYTALGRLVGVGRVWVDADGAPTLTLKGVYDPERVADRIRGCAQRAREHVGNFQTV